MKTKLPRGTGSAPREPTRRHFVRVTLGGLTTAALLGGCGDEGLADPSATGGTGASGAGGGASTTTTTGAGAAGAGGAGVGGAGTGGAGGATCSVYPQETPGPFYLDLDLVRSDITEGKPGKRVTLAVDVVRASDCEPIAGAVVDVWHCDAAGIYSGFPGQLGGLDTTGEKFLRGTQIADADGRVTFVTIYPGWYPGRTTHIHFKVHLGNSEAVSQMYFPEDVTAAVYQATPYDVHGQKDTPNTLDGPANTGEMPALLELVEGADGYDAKLTISVVG